MYTASERTYLLQKIIDFIQEAPAFEGLLQIGSGSMGFADIYSDIDLMAGCYNADALTAANQQLSLFFTELGAFHIEKRTWTKTALGLSAYFPNGLSCDISFLLTPELPIRSPQYKLLFSKTERFTTVVQNRSRVFEECNRRYGLDDTIHYRFLLELRHVEIALLRGQFIFADISLSNARQLLLAVESVTEKKKLHQFKAYNTLDEEFLVQLEETYPITRSRMDINAAAKKLLVLYLHTVIKCDFLSIDRNLLNLLGCFD